MLDDCMFLCCTVSTLKVKTRNECQLTNYLLPLSNVATEVLFQSSFSLCRLRRTTRWYGLDEQSTQRTTERDTARTETERVSNETR